MSINFIPNDPLVTGLPLRKVAPVKDRPAGRVTFAVDGTDPAAVYAPGTPGFLRWQTRQAALLAVQAWEKVLGTPLTAWSTGAVDPVRLPLKPDAGKDLNAYYDRASVSFFHYPVGTDTVLSGASTDVVSHEVGHAVLDAARPDLWNTNFIEVGGFHEAFGDVTAILTALNDRASRLEVLAASPDLGTANDIEATAEQLSDAVRRVLGPTHPAAKPRQALNDFVWQLPSTMPTKGGPDVMIAEVHSIARIMSGCFYDVLRGVFAAGTDHSERGLWLAARTTGRLFHAAAKAAPQTPRFFQSVGRAMVLVDQNTLAGANRQVIGQAFARHGIALGTNALLAPEIALAGAPPTANLQARGALGAVGEAHVEAATQRDLRRRLDVPRGTTLTVSAVPFDGGVAKVKFRTPVTLDGVDARLAGVVALSDVQVLVGESGGHSAVLGALPHPDHNADAVREFAGALAAHGQIDFTGGDGRRRRPAEPSPRDGQPTHHVVRRGRQRVLERVRFTC